MKLGLKLRFIKPKIIFGLKRKELKHFYPKEILQNHRDLNDKNHETLKSIFFFPLLPQPPTPQNSHCSDLSHRTAPINAEFAIAESPGSRRLSPAANARMQLALARAASSVACGLLLQLLATLAALTAGMRLHRVLRSVLPLKFPAFCFL